MRVKRVPYIIPALLLFGCSAFDPMTREEIVAEQGQCSANALCRWADGDRPAELLGDVNDETNCLKHAEEARRRLQRGMIVVGSTKDGPHAVLVVDGWVIDDGYLSRAKVFPVRDLPHLMRVRQ